MITFLSVTDAFGWSEILLITLIGFGLVFVVLVLLIYIIKLFGAAFTRKNKAVSTNAEAVAVPSVQTSDEAEVAAVAAAIFLAENDNRNAGVLTFAPRTASAWNSKIFTLTNLPERK